MSKWRSASSASASRMLAQCSTSSHGSTARAWATLSRKRRDRPPTKREQPHDPYASSLTHILGRQKLHCKAAAFGLRLVAKRAAVRPQNGARDVKAQASVKGVRLERAEEIFGVRHARPSVVKANHGSIVFDAGGNPQLAALAAFHGLLAVADQV